MVEVDLVTFAAAHSEGAVVIDVREPHEYMAGHVADARLVPLGHLPAYAAEIPRGEPVFVICSNGNRSGIASDYLDRLGVKVYAVAGGTTAWQQTGRLLVTGPGLRAA
ncbi:rhodanese-like domain-containing protein [Micromonospora purpureochromogenes]|uniref:rhodanese-like domain-containing protein n=1 Tax=Micromonospora purpureochromogenes TaxID=47872 RepID=UPI0033333837